LRWRDATSSGGRQVGVAMAAASATSLGIALLLLAGGVWCTSLDRVGVEGGASIELVECPVGARALRRVGHVDGARDAVGATRWSVSVPECAGDALALADGLVVLPVRAEAGGIATAAYSVETGERRFLAPHRVAPDAGGFRAPGYVARGVGGGRLVEALPYGSTELRALASDTGAELWRVSLPGTPGDGRLGLRLVGGALQLDGTDGRTVFRVRLADGRIERLGGSSAAAVCPLDRAVVILDRSGFLSVAPVDGGVPVRLGRPGAGSLPSCAAVGRRLYVVWKAEGAPSPRASGHHDGRAIEDPFVPIGSGGALYAFDSGRFVHGRAFSWGAIVAPFARPDTPSAPPPGETVEIRVEGPSRARRFRVDLGSGRFGRLVPPVPPG
jgi:hypothetical protein